MTAKSLGIIIVLVTSMNASAAEPNKWKKPEGEPLFTTVSREDEQMNEACRKAKLTLPRFLEAIKSKKYPSTTNAVKIKIKDQDHSEALGEDRYVFLWVWGVKEEGADLRASVLELPKEKINDLVEGRDVVFPRAQVCDWMICQGPKVWGAFTMRVLRDRMDAKERAQYDEYTGLSSYNEEMP